MNIGQEQEEYEVEIVEPIPGIEKQPARAPSPPAPVESPEPVAP